MLTLLAILGAMAHMQVASAVLGVDVSQETLPSAFECLKKSGHDFVVVRGWQSNGQADPAAPHTIYNAWDGGMNNVDVYVFPCFRCGNPASQIGEMIHYLKSFNVVPNPKGGKYTYGQIWLDIEGPQYWGSQSENVAFIREMISAVKGAGINCAIYTSESQWEPITGNANIASDLPLWYAHYDGNPSFSDFAPFAGWTHPAIKQYKGTTDTCGASVDLNYYP